MSSNDERKFEKILNDLNAAGESSFSNEAIRRLSLYYALVLKWNSRVSLTSITDPGEFFERHILESRLVADLILDSISDLWDIGSGLGIPGLPIAIFKPELQVHLVESGKDKSIFLEEAVHHLRLDNVKVIRARFESLDPLPANCCLTARAVEKMEIVVREMLRLGAECGQILLLGGESLLPSIDSLLPNDLEMRSRVIEGSSRRLIIEIVPRETF